MSEIIKHLNEDSFQQTIDQGVTFVDFYADWCGPCHMMNPILEELAQDMQGKATVAKINVDEAQTVASSLGITSIPTMILFKEGKEVDRLIGVSDKDSITQIIDKAF